MEKRVLLAIFLTFVVLYAYQALFVPKTPTSVRGKPVPAPAQQVEGPAQGAAAGTAAGSQPGGIPSQKESAKVEPGQSQAEAPAPVVAESAEREIIVETRVVRAVFSNRGARLKSWELKKFTDERGKLLDLVPQVLNPDTTRAFELRVDKSDITSRLNGSLFAANGISSQLDATKAPVTLVFEFADAAGLRARKEFTLAPDSYVVTLTADVSEGGRSFNPTIELGPGLGDVNETAAASRYMQKAEGIYFGEGKIWRVSAKELASQPSREGVYRYIGVDDHYFLSVALPTRAARVDYQPVVMPPRSQGGAALELVSYGVRVSQGAAGVKFYLGPKDFDVLAGVDRELVRTINFGIFAFLAVPLLRALNGINAYVGNYGWSIIILTILINAVMFPLRHKSVVSMRKMQELQPEIKAIQDRYGKLKPTDPARQKMNQEVMDLYRQRGVNPASGCIPMLLTMPILFAFYSLLSQAIDLRGAPFMLWITDLSARDPYYVTPLLMGATMVWQQKITPTGTDPTQQKMMMMMPLVFTFMFLWTPSGLALYFFASNLLGIAQQYVTNRIIGPPAVRTVRAPAERKLKRVGGGKTEDAASGK
jgi:YidC/Oxa1 family membrane protein insertase